MKGLCPYDLTLGGYCIPTPSWKTKNLLCMKENHPPS